MLRTSKFLLAGALAIASATAAMAEKKLALVIGNGAYQHATPLPNPTNDAQAMSSKFRELGFDVIEGYNLDRMNMDMALRDFAKQSRDSDINVFFYAGHGMSVDGSNYLVPVDAVFADETALDFEAVKVDFVTRQMAYADAVNLIFLDACRDNPLSRTLSRSIGKTRSASVANGLAEMRIDTAGKGMAIAFATSPGEVAQDGDGQHSPFTDALLKHIGAENTDITEVFSRVTGDVYSATGQTQRPWLNVSLTGSVMLNQQEVTLAAATPTPAAAATVDPSKRMENIEEQKLLFELARDTGDIADYQAYLARFPSGVFSSNAKRMVEELTVARGINPNAERIAPVAATGQIAGQYGTVGQKAVIGTPGNFGTYGSADAIQEAGPLVLVSTPAVQMKPATDFTEKELELDRTAKGNIQARLNATGNNVGGVDGVWGSKTRRGISNWQVQNGLAASGYLNASQLQMLTAQTEGKYTPYVAPVKKKYYKPSSKQRRNNNNNAAAAAVMGAIVGAIIAR